MVRKRAKSKPVQLGKEQKMKYIRACEIAKALDNLPPLIDDFIDND